MVLIGWVFDIRYLESVIPNLVAMKINTAFCFILIGCALVIKTRQHSKFADWAYYVLLLLVCSIGGITLLEYQFNFDAHIDQLFAAEDQAINFLTPFPGRMAYNTAVSFLLLSIGLLGLSTKPNKFLIFFQCLLHVVTLVSGVAIIGYIYRVTSLYSFSYASPMAVHTAIVLFLLSAAGSLLNPELGLTKLFKGQGIGNAMARRHFSSLMLVLVVFGSLRSHSKFFDVMLPQFGISWLAISLLITSFIMIWKTANWLNKIDQQRTKAEEEIKTINATLEIKVEERSAKLRELYLELQKSEERYHSLFEHASDAIYVLNTEGDFMDVNDSVCQMTGYSRQELLGMNITSLLNDELLENYPLIYTAIEPGRSAIVERKIITRGGEILDVEINVKRFADQRILVIARDITRRKQMEAELRMAELKFRTLAEKSMVGIYIVQQGRFVYVNPRFAEIFGYQAEELIGAFAIEKVVHEEQRKMVDEMIRLRKEKLVEGVHYEMKGKKKDGSVNWVEFYGTMSFYQQEPMLIGSVIDITDRKRAEEELKMSEQKYRMLFESNPLPLWIVAKDDLTVIAANAAAAKLYGYTPEELLHMDIKKLRPAAHWEKLTKHYHTDFKEAFNFGIFEHLKKGGTRIMVSIIAQDIMFEGRFARLSSTNDVTEKLMAEESLKISEANLQTILNNTDTAYALLNADLDVLEYNNKALIFARNEFSFDPAGRVSFIDLMPPERRLKFISYTAEVFQGNTISYEASYPQADDSNLWYAIRMFPIADKGNKILGLVLAINDITEQKEAEQDLQKAYQSIQLHIGKIQAMAWEQSHLIRSPLANLKALFPMLKMSAEDAEVGSHIEFELERMDDILLKMAEGASITESEKTVDPNG
ncbi:hypothetical protein N824_29615 [Pedobacter sp. V48]|nr:hypothetical protein N824_29615 [Pedobacter sp. V48]